MKTLLSIVTVSIIALGLPASSFAADKPGAKAADGAKKAAEKPAAKPEAAAEKVAGEPKPLPMNSRADTIDASTKSFVMKRKDGVEVKHVLAATAEIKNGAAAAKFEDIKVGDYVSGLRKKKSDTEYEVVKITKFGAKPPVAKKDGEAKPAEKKAE